MLVKWHLFCSVQARASADDCPIKNHRIIDSMRGGEYLHEGRKPEYFGVLLQQQ